VGYLRDGRGQFVVARRGQRIGRGGVEDLHAGEVSDSTCMSMPLASMSAMRSDRGPAVDR
jgi:hypothetical protein